MNCRENVYIGAKKLFRLSEERLGRMVGACGLTATQGFLLLYIGQEHPDGTYVSDLHKELGFSMATISGGIKVLKQKGFLTMEVSKTDERLKKVSVTDKFQTVSEKLKQAISQLENDLFDGLDQDEQDAFRELTRKILETKTFPEHKELKEEEAVSC